MKSKSPAMTSFMIKGFVLSFFSGDITGGFSLTGLGAGFKRAPHLPQNLFGSGLLYPHFGQSINDFSLDPLGNIDFDSGF